MLTKNKIARNLPADLSNQLENSLRSLILSLYPANKHRSGNVGISQTHLSHFLSGRRGLSIDSLAEIMYTMGLQLVHTGASRHFWQAVIPFEEYDAQVRSKDRNIQAEIDRLTILLQQYRSAKEKETTPSEIPDISMGSSLPVDFSKLVTCNEEE